MSNELAVLPKELVRQSTDIASLCKDIVTSTAVTIQRKKYVRVEGWQSIATAHGCVASARDVERIEGGVRAIGEIRRMSDGALIATAEGFVGEDEPVWFGGKEHGKTYQKRPDYAIRAMAQTRAISRACRSCFAHVVVLMDAGLSTTPAEEVPYGGFQDTFEDHKPKYVQQVGRGNRDQEDGVDMDYPTGTNIPVIPDKWQDTRIHFGKNGPGMHLGEPVPGKKLSELPQRTLNWYQLIWPQKGWQLSPEDVALRNALDKSIKENAGNVKGALDKAISTACADAGVERQTLIDQIAAGYSSPEDLTVWELYQNYLQIDDLLKSIKAPKEWEAGDDEIPGLEESGGGSKSKKKD